MGGINEEVLAQARVLLTHSRYGVVRLQRLERAVTLPYPTSAFRDSAKPLNAIVRLAYDSPTLYRLFIKDVKKILRTQTKERKATVDGVRKERNRLYVKEYRERLTWIAEGIWLKEQRRIDDKEASEIYRTQVNHLYQAWVQHEGKGKHSPSKLNKAFRAYRDQKLQEALRLENTPRP